VAVAHCIDEVDYLGLSYGVIPILAFKDVNGRITWSGFHRNKDISFVMDASSVDYFGSES
jgi:hypothetical protein